MVVFNGEPVASRWPVPPSGVSSGVKARRPKHAVEMREAPRRPEEVERNRIVARQRRSELREIFTHKQDDREVLRTRLSTLDAEAEDLRTKIAAVERELAEAAAERVMKENSKHEDDKLPPNAGNTPRGGSPSPGANANNTPTDAPSDNQEVLSPLLQHRRAEARFEEAIQCHDSAMKHFNGELQSLRRRKLKQQAWMKQVEAQVLQAEITKSRYEVRLTAAEKRCRQLGKDLSQAYDTMSRLLEERLAVAGEAAKNDALVAYLNQIAKADNQNAANFMENRDELRRLGEANRRLKESSERWEFMCEELREREMMVVEVVEHTEEIMRFNEQLRRIWISVPAHIKEDVLVASFGGLDAGDMNPAAATGRIQSDAGNMLKEMNRYLALLESVSNEIDQTEKGDVGDVLEESGTEDNEEDD